MTLGDFEELVLPAVLRLSPYAYGPTIHRDIEPMAGRGKQGPWKNAAAWGGSRVVTLGAIFPDRDSIFHLFDSTGMRAARLEFRLWPAPPSAA